MPKRVVVTIKSGKVRGIKEKSPIFDSEFYSFYGIPYGQPPIHNLRFKDPVKVKPWKNIHDGTLKKEGCLQFSLIQHRIMGSEDCLYVNVHTPNLPKEGNSLKAVIALIHPGGQQWGSPDPNYHGSPNFIMHHDIVYVTIAFRLNIFGFLNLNMGQCSGNQGIKDIIMAFEWIKENIKIFNGDPENITAIGPSSGATVIHLLMLSPAVKGLFHKAILMGCYIFNTLVPYRDNQLKLALDFAKNLGFKGEDTKELLKFLKCIPGNTFIVEMKQFQEKLEKNLVKSFSGGAFMEGLDLDIMPESPRQFINSIEHIPIIFGICEKESIIGFIPSMMPTKEEIFEKSYRQNIWGWMHNFNDEKLEEINKQIESYYFKNQPKNIRSLATKIDISSDAAFSEVYDTLINPISADRSTSVYLYKFQYQSEIAVLKQKIGELLQEKVEGTFHTDDMCYWTHMLTPKKENTVQMIHKFTKFLTTFAKTGNPNYDNTEVQWKPTTPEEPCYLNINTDLTMTNDKLNGERMNFWDSLKKLHKMENF